MDGKTEQAGMGVHRLSPVVDDRRFSTTSPALNNHDRVKPSDPHFLAIKHQPYDLVNWGLRGGGCLSGMPGTDETRVVSLPMVAAEAAHGSLETYIDFDSPMGTNIYEAVGLNGSKKL